MASIPRDSFGRFVLLGNRTGSTETRQTGQKRRWSVTENDMTGQDSLRKMGRVCAHFCTSKQGIDKWCLWKSQASSPISESLIFSSIIWSCCWLSWSFNILLSLVSQLLLACNSLFPFASWSFSRSRALMSAVDIRATLVELMWLDLLQNPTRKEKKDVPLLGSELTLKIFALSELELPSDYLNQQYYICGAKDMSGSCLLPAVTQFKALRHPNLHLPNISCTWSFPNGFFIGCAEASVYEICNFTQLVCDVEGAGWYSLPWSRRVTLRADCMMHSRPKLTPTTLKTFDRPTGQYTHTPTTMIALPIATNSSIKRLSCSHKCFEPINTHN